MAALQSQVEAVVRNHLRVGDEQLSLSATVDYVVKRVGVFALKLAVPEGFRIESVNGVNVLQWNERNEANERVLEVTLKGTHGGRILVARGTSEADEGAAEVAVARRRVAARNAEAVRFVSVSAEPGVSVKTAAFEGLTEIPVGLLPNASAVAGESGLLAFKFIAAETGVAAAWKLSVTTETVEPWCAPKWRAR